ncbi:MAG: methyltransferase domain-containing protein [Microbacteriaceae bacterium]
MDWSSFVNSTPDRAVRPFLAQALAMRAEAARDGGLDVVPNVEPGVVPGVVPAVAIDLGCGDGAEARHLAADGWQVYAFDGAEGVEARVVAGVPVEHADRLTVTRVKFEELDSLPACDLMYAGRSLPFCAQKAFPRLWHTIVGAIAPDGWFVGDFFGPNDSWVGRPDMNFHGRQEIADLLVGFELDRLEEAEGTAHTPFGDKHMHILSVVAHRPITSPELPQMTLPGATQRK